MALGKLLTDNFITKAFGIFGKLVKDKDLKEKLNHEFLVLSKTHEQQIDKFVFEDRKNARMLYGKDAEIQKVYSIVFLCGYIIISVGLIVILFLPDKMPELPDWGIGLIGTIFGAMSSKVNTITDFFFGSSKESK